MWTLPLIAFVTRAVSRHLKINRRRATIRELLSFDDKTLYDIGFSRDALYMALDEPAEDDLFENVKTRSRRQYTIGGAPQRIAAAPSLHC